MVVRCDNSEGLAQEFASLSQQLMALQGRESVNYDRLQSVEILIDKLKFNIELLTGE